MQCDGSVSSDRTCYTDWTATQFVTVRSFPTWCLHIQLHRIADTLIQSDLQKSRSKAYPHAISIGQGLSMPLSQDYFKEEFKIIIVFIWALVEEECRLPDDSQWLICSDQPGEFHMLYRDAGLSMILCKYVKLNVEI